MDIITQPTTGGRMKLKTLEVQNFRSIYPPIRLEELSSDIEVFHGLNNTGKSNIFQAIAVGMRLLLDERMAYAGASSVAHLWSALTDGRPTAHRSHSAEPTVLTLEIQDPDVRVRFRLDPQLNGPLITQEVLSGSLPRMDAASFLLVNDLRRPPRTASTWDEWLLHQRDTDSSGAAARRFRAIEKALQRTFSETLGPGRLGRTFPPWSDTAELAWEGDDDSIRPFSAEGSGMRQLIRILIALLGSPAQIVAIEEPETNLSEEAQARLLTLLRETARQSHKQILITSHVYTFDGARCRRVTLDPDGYTSVSPTPQRTSSVFSAPIDMDGRLPLQERLSRALSQQYSEAQQPVPGFVNANGITQLPLSVREKMHLPELLTFAHLPGGAFVALPEHVLQDAADAQDEE